MHIYMKIFVEILIEKDVNTKFNPLTFALVSKDACFTLVTSLKNYFNYGTHILRSIFDSRDWQTNRLTKWFFETHFKICAKVFVCWRHSVLPPANINILFLSSKDVSLRLIKANALENTNSAVL